MTLRRLLALAVMSGLLCASPAFAQSEEDPEPEVSDAGPENLYERLLAVSATGGWDTPFGVIGGGIEFAPIQWINIYAGGGVSRSGGRFTLGVNFRAPIHSTAFGVQLGVSGGPLDHDATGDDPLHRYWEFALFVNAGLNVEYRFDMGVFLRLAGGAKGRALRPVAFAGRVGQRLHLLVADIGHRRVERIAAARVAQHRVVAGIGFDAAAPAAAAQRAVGNVDHMAEFAARGMRAGEEPPAQHQPHANAVRQKDRVEIVLVALRRAPSQRLGDHVAVVLHGYGEPELGLEQVAEGNVAVRGDRRPQQRRRVGIGDALNGQRQP